MHFLTSSHATIYSGGWMWSSGGNRQCIMKGFHPTRALYSRRKPMTFDVIDIRPAPRCKRSEITRGWENTGELFLSTHTFKTHTSVLIYLKWIISNSYQIYTSIRSAKTLQSTCGFSVMTLAWKWARWSHISAVLNPVWLWSTSDIRRLCVLDSFGGFCGYCHNITVQYSVK